jgi:hypothetical protein
MKNLFDPNAVTEVKRRLASLEPRSERLWGTMSPARMLAHCTASVETALGDRTPPRMFIGRLLGRFIKPLVLAGTNPLRRNAPTAPEFIIADERDFQTERQRLDAVIDRFAGAGPAGCTTHPHSLFGRMSAEEWGVLLYKHLDHHLRQFGV